jgi:hypothetical protein
LCFFLNLIIYYTYMSQLQEMSQFDQLPPALQALIPADHHCRKSDTPFWYSKKAIKELAKYEKEALKVAFLRNKYKIIVSYSSSNFKDAEQPHFFYFK